MKQYCKYCAFCIESDSFYCTSKEKIVSKHSGRTCKEFVLSELGDVETGKQYKPRESRAETIGNQLEF